MKVIYRVDETFISLFSILIFASGLLLTLIVNNPFPLALSLGVLFLYLFLSLKRPLRRWKAVKTPLPRKWREFLMNKFRFYRNLDEKGRERFENDVKIFLSDFPVRGIRGGEVDQLVKLTIAACVAVVLHGRPHWEPPLRDGVVVYPGERFSEEYEPGRGHLAGQAPRNGPMLIAGESLIYDVENPEGGQNVVYHEMAHFFDWEDGEAGGIPASRLEPGLLPRWKEVIEREWKRAREGDSALRPYASTHPSETFAVATEVFFTTPLILRRHHPQLYDLLRRFYNIDPARILYR